MPEPGKAVTDIKYLLDRGYPRKGAITFVCNHYRLDIKWRYVFTRVVFGRDTIQNRREKTVKCEDLDGEVVLVDGYNVLIGVESALKGEPVYLCDDGFLRDIRGVFRNYRCSGLTERAMNEILVVLTDFAPFRVEFLFDSQISKSGEMARWVETKLKDVGLSGIARTSRHVDHDLKQSNGIIATADGSIIDEVPKAVNIQACVLEQLNLSPVIIEGVFR
ncbi:MAG: hypothetical protein C5S44_09440 [Candidatus Methanocomedens sp.]|nr:MAG: hypothetical protein C5S44_09440 [ANME-2 cluster archaeon]